VHEKYCDADPYGVPMAFQTNRARQHRQLRMGGIGLACYLTTVGINHKGNGGLESGVVVEQSADAGVYNVNLFGQIA